VHVRDADAATPLRFLGSPHCPSQWLDVEPGAEKRGDFVERY
jgi:hypothetical protein